MKEDRLDRIEEMLTSIIAMVGKTNSIQQSMENRLQGLENRFQGLEDRIQGLENRMQGLENRMQGLEDRMQGLENRMQGLEDRMQGLEDRMQTMENTMQGIIAEQAEIRKENEIRFNKIDEKIDSLLADQDHIWEKAVRNEREITKIKRHLDVL
ncbi:hypothetical protein PB1_08292 [Bacillus methanolicus PB1]|uniref:Uncharacterized protein n=1 Tax=Bacillus methanolicus PB1 TaxID=997296 RepID=I3E1H5_BACMT|nr:hypothetical protein [Bacillus methanolicus]EIJ80346.1 hypothetical protein PB1_08292 [Bacillus methanolicus PB1]